jgi:hypothetical protein
MVPGQIKAESYPFCGVKGFPTESQMAASVKALPKEVRGKCIGDGTDLMPAVGPGQVIKCSIEHGKWRFLSFTDSYSVCDSKGDPLAGGVYIKEVSNKLLGMDRIVMHDCKDKPICLAVRDKIALTNRYNIYGTGPLLPDDKAEMKEQDVDFYPWFRVRDIDDSHLDHRSILVWNGNNFQPMLKIVAARRLPGSQNDDLVPPRKGDNLVCDLNDPTIVLALLSKTSEKNIAGWKLCIAPGTDPMAMIMLAAIMDKMVGWLG